jgi:glycolate oxidase
MGQINDYICLDGTIPVAELPHVLRRTNELAASYGLGVANVFHAGDGNMHPLILFDANTPGELEKAEALGADILRLCVEVGGCLSGEHGVGVEKRDLMTDQFGPVDLEMQMRVKDVFDPGWRLNPAKVFPLALSEARRSGRAAAGLTRMAFHEPDSETGRRRLRPRGARRRRDARTAGRRHAPRPRPPRSGRGDALAREP